MVQFRVFPFIKKKKEEQANKPTQTDFVLLLMVNDDDEYNVAQQHTQKKTIGFGIGNCHSRALQADIIDTIIGRSET